MSESYDTIRWSYDESRGVGTIVLDRPDSMNAMSSQLRQDVNAGFERFEEIDDDGEGVQVRAVIVTGAGDRAFCAGADINEFEEVPSDIIELRNIFLTIEDFGAPVIAKIDGYCLGGGLELALACDFRFASHRSELGQTEINIGLIPGGGGTQRLLPLVGTSKTKELCMTGDRLSGSEAEAEGIVDKVHSSDELEEAVDAFAKRLASKPPLAVRAVKDAVNTGQNTGLHEGWMHERRLFNELRQTEDHAEGASAFAEKREPEWKGK